MAERDEDKITTPPSTEQTKATKVDGVLGTVEPLSRAASTNDDATVPEPKPLSGDFKVSTFANRDMLAWWFPQIDDDEKSNIRIWLSKRSRTLVVQIIMVGVIFLTNLSLTAFAVARYSSEKGVGLIYEGDCAKVGQLDRWLHLLINLLSTGMLSASNYVMQLQAAPTRENIDKAHARNSWLDIGVPSLRNIGYIGNWRRVAWCLLALSSVPVHLIYNSAVFQSLSSFDYTVAVAKDSFLDGSPWSLETAERNRAGDPGWDEARVNPASYNYTDIIHGIQRDSRDVPYVNLNVSECFDLYDDYFTPQGNVVVLVKNQSIQVPTNDSLLMYVSVIPRSDAWGKNLWALGNGTGGFVVLHPSKPVTEWLLGPPKYEVSHCLAQPTDNLVTHCRLEYCPWIMFTICTLNFLKASVMLAIWSLRKWQDTERVDTQKEVLYTLGDAIASFMRKPDPYTKGMCLATKDDFVSSRSWRTRFIKKTPQKHDNPPPRMYKIEARRWMAAGSIRRWTVLLSMCFIVILVASVLLGTGFQSLNRRHITTSLPDLWNMGFGQLQPFEFTAIGLPTHDPTGLIANVLVANLPQLILSIIYIFYNSMLSTFLVQREFSNMWRKRKPLRVSEPVGIQRSSYFISLPLRYGVPLYASSGVMHWLISQSFFLARITAFHPDGTKDDLNSFSTCGYSMIAIFITLLVGLALVVAIVMIGFRTYDGTMGMVSTNSRAISAACHIMSQDRQSGYLLPVQWGVVEIEGGIGHCTFTTAPKHEIKLPEEGQLYR